MVLGERRGEGRGFTVLLFFRAQRLMNSPIKHQHLYACVACQIGVRNVAMEKRTIQTLLTKRNVLYFQRKFSSTEDVLQKSFSLVFLRMQDVTASWIFPIFIWLGRRGEHPLALLREGLLREDCFQKKKACTSGTPFTCVTSVFISFGSQLCCIRIKLIVL